jgi:hypothetical protein
MNMQQLHQHQPLFLPTFIMACIKFLPSKDISSCEEEDLVYMVLCEAHYNAKMQNDSMPASPPTSANSAWPQLTLSLLLLGSYQYVANPCHFIVSKEFDVCFVANWVLLEPLDAKLSSPVTGTWNWENVEQRCSSCNLLAKDSVLGRNNAVLGSCDHCSVTKQNKGTSQLQSRKPIHIRYIIFFWLPASCS